MSQIRAVIKGVHGYLPDYVLTNKELESMVDTNDEWIQTRTGIKERRILKEPGKATSDMGVEAVIGLLKKCDLEPNDIDLMICGTVTADMIFPDTATTILHKIGAQNAVGFDINAACSGFLFTMTTAAQFVMNGTYRNVIVVGADMMSTITNYDDRATCILFGDAAAAVLLQPAENGGGMIDSYLRSDGTGREFLYMKAGGSLNPPSIESVQNNEHTVYQEGRPVFKAAVKGMAGAVDEIMMRNNLSSEDIAWIVPHQANLRIIQSVANHANISMDKVMVNIQKYGNTTSATIPLCLWEWEDQLKKGDLIILTAFGGGYTWGASLWEWGY
jgi:3-oxoacyl-[acyl-carrier-protein] synthase-3